MADSVRKILADTREFLQFQAEMGITELPLTPELKDFLATPATPPPAAPQSLARPQSQRPNPSVAPPLRKTATTIPSPPPLPEVVQPIGELHQEVANCRLCQLEATRQRVVPGSGAESARLLVITEQPGAAEENAGTPLAGAAGELFDRMLQAIKLERGQIYLTSLVKCRPPEDREASAAEIHSCMNYLFRQIAAINPTVICGLGPLTAKILTGSPQPLFQLRGRFHDFHGTPLLVTFHPSFLLRHPEMKKASWQDLLIIQKKLADSNR